MKKTFLSICLMVIAVIMLGACASTNTAATISTATVATAAAVQATATSPAQAAAGDTSAPPAPPDSAVPGGAPPGSGSTSAAAGLASATGAYTLDGGTATEENQTYTATNEDQSGVYVINNGNLTLTNPTVVTSGNTSSQDSSSFYGLNAGVLASGGSRVTISGGTISTIGTGANGVFTQGSGTSVTLSDVTIAATADGGHGVMATNGGVMTLTNVDMTTAGPHSGVIATDRGGGTITVTGGTVLAKGADSPAIYSTGVISATDAVLTATGAEAAVIEGGNTIILNNADLSTTLEGKWGVMIYQSMSGDAEGTQGTFTMTGGSLAYTSATGPLFYVNNSTGVITLKGVKIAAASGVLIDASANSRWGTSGSNGGTVIFTADSQTLGGSITADNISAVTITLQNGSALTGAINSAHTAKAANLILDASSTWTVTADSYLTCLTTPSIAGDSITNITGNGHTVTYDATACPALDGKTYTLNGGGTLTPAK
jgi:hypothetical protein